MKKLQKVFSLGEKFFYGHIRLATRKGTWPLPIANSGRPTSSMDFDGDDIVMQMLTHEDFRVKTFH